MKLDEFKKRTNGRYTFYRDEEIEKRGYAICYDEICTIDLEDKNLYKECTYNTDNKTDITFDSEEELLDYVIENKNIRQRIEDLKDLMRYHVSMVEIDSKGNIKGAYEPYDCGNIKDYIRR